MLMSCIFYMQCAYMFLALCWFGVILRHVLTEIQSLIFLMNPIFITFLFQYLLK